VALLFRTSANNESRQRYCQELELWIAVMIRSAGLREGSEQPGRWVTTCKGLVRPFLIVFPPEPFEGPLLRRE
jgi:hypothetical protein